MKQEMKQKLRDDRMGKNNPFYNKKHSKKTKQKLREGKLKRKVLLGYINSMETRQKIKENHVDMSGSKNPMYGKKHSIITKRKIREAIIKNLKLGKYNLKPNIPEQVVINLIQQHNLNFIYVGNGKRWIGQFNPDFINKEKTLIIEVFGDYWHGKKNKYYNAFLQDKERLKVYTKQGYKTLVIWERELKDKNRVLCKILNFIKNNYLSERRLIIQNGRRKS